MDDEDRYVRLSVDDDFEGGQWIGGEFFYRSKRQKTVQSAEDKLYGVFGAADSSDEEAGGGGGGGRSHRKKERSNFSKPVAFVSTGKIEPGRDLDEPAVKQEPQAKVQELHTMGPMKAPDEESSDMDLEADVLPTALGRRIRDAAAKREQEEKSKTEQEKAWKNAEKSGFATFERHTKGIGAKLLAKMGYKPGQGLGRGGAGITKPVEQKLRPKGMGMGYGDFKEHSARLIPDENEPTKNDEGVPAPAKQNKGKLWKKRHGAERKKRIYRTAEDVLVAEDDRSSLIAQPIIDMRGPQARVITNLEHLNVEDANVDTGEKVPMPELQHNMKLLVDIAEADIKRLDSNLRQKEDSAVMLGREEKRLESELDIRTKEVDRLTALQEGMQHVVQIDAITNLEAVESGYKELMSEYEEEYNLYNVASAALGQVLIPFQRLFAGWDVLADPGFGVSQVLRWRNILLSSAAQREAIFEDSVSPDPFTTLISYSCVPHIRSAITNSWEPRNPEPLIRLIESWEHIWPSTVLNHVLLGLVFPKLRALVEVWEPRNEVIAVHVWMHPWLPYLGDHMTDVYPTIIFRMSTALQSWHASDGSAYALLSPWHRVFGDQLWDGLLMRSILPKLAFALQEMVINPLSQDVKPFNWVMQWKDVISANHMASILESQFFPKWLQVLHQWLSSNPNYEEVTHWYLGWKEMIPENIRDDARVAAQLGNALSLMNSAVEGSDLPSVSVYPTGPVVPPPPPAPDMASYAETSDVYTLRDLVLRFAEENNVEFLPKAGRMHDGLQVYGFGQVNCILENLQNVVRAQIHHQWVIVTLSRLLEEHQSRVIKGHQGGQG